VPALAETTRCPPDRPGEGPNGRKTGGRET
jgi:hypothetical protein